MSRLKLLFLLQQLRKLKEKVHQQRSLYKAPRFSSCEYGSRLKNGRLLLLSAQYLAQKKRIAALRIKRRRWWIRPILQLHDSQGAWAVLVPLMREKDKEKFYNFFRMTPSCFDKLLDLVRPFLEKNAFRRAVPPGERLAITLRFLASGDSFQSLEYLFLVSEKTISNIVFETTTVIYNVLRPIVFEELSEDMWLQKAAEFEALWNVPHCIGAIDGKHVRIQAPPHSGSRFFNYKDFFSIILMAVCDAKQKFTMVDVGSSGRRGDGNVYHQSVFRQMMKEKKLKIPPKCNVEGMEMKLPFFFVGDAAFMRSKEMVVPFRGRFLPPERKVFNYRISRARKAIENAFGMLYQRFEVFSRPLQVSLPHLKSIVLCCTALHNFHLMDTDSSIPSRWKTRPGPYEDQPEKGEYGRYKNEDTKKENMILNRLQTNVLTSGNDHSSVNVNDMIEELVDYFIEEDLPWQWVSAGIVSE